jgi:hypothetical protein
MLKFQSQDPYKSQKVIDFKFPFVEAMHCKKWFNVEYIFLKSALFIRPGNLLKAKIFIAFSFKNKIKSET